MATQLQIKRSSITGRTPNTTNSGNSTYIAAGELAVNLTDGKLFTSNGSTLITVGSNLDSLSVNSVSITGQITVNSSVGAAGQILTSGGGAGNVYWSTVTSGGLALTANSTDTQTFFFPMSNTTAGSWANAVVDSTDLSYIPSSGLLTVPSANLSGSLTVNTVNVVSLNVTGVVTTGNTTVTGFVNVSSYGTFGGTVNTAALNVLGVATAGNTTITGFVNSNSYGSFSGVVNAASFNSTGSATSTFANNVTVTGTANVVVLNVTGTSPVTANGGFGTRVTSVADSTSVTINADTTDIATQTNTQTAGTLTINAPTGTLSNGQKLVFRLQSTNVQTFSWNAVFIGSADLSLPSSSTGSSKYDYVGFIYNSTASKWHLLAKNFGF